MRARPRRTTLLVVESPAKALTLRRLLPGDVDVRATAGHLLDLPPRREGIDVAHGYAPAWELVRGKGRLLSELKRAAREVERVLVATDPDREGEAIGWHLASELGAVGGDERIGRIALPSVTGPALQAALASPFRLDRARFEAQLARRVVDRLIGFRVSARLSAELQRGLSVGRVQAAALRLAAAVARGEVGPGAARPAGVTAPFDTVTLLRQASASLALRPRRTAALAQRLYEGLDLGDDGRSGLITYPRSGSTALSPVSGHGAIVPARLDWPPDRARPWLEAEGGRDLARLYRLIWERFEARGGVERPEPRPEDGRGLDDAGLLQALEQAGVGRPSTFATIGETLEGRGYLARQGRRSSLTPLGQQVVRWLEVRHPRTLDAAFTAGLESDLDRIEAGEVAWQAVVSRWWEPLEPALGEALA